MSVLPNLPLVTTMSLAPLAPKLTLTVLPRNPLASLWPRMLMRLRSVADDDDDEGLVTREMLQRDLLQDPQVKRKRNKNGKSGYKPLDNRDHLPFAVKKITPDPYTRPQVNNSKRKTTTASERKKKTDLDHQLTSSRLYQNSNDENASTLLGEFQLDKSTTSGDVIYIGQREYQVQRARCQYKYAGGQRFVMVRKILEVKEVNRVAKEELLMRQYQQSDSSNPDNPPELE